MIPLNKQQCGNCRYARPFKFCVDGSLDSCDSDQFACFLAMDGAHQIDVPKTCWCGKWELHPDFYEVYGYPSEAEQLEQQRMMAFGPAHIGDPAPQAPTEFTYD